MRNADFTSDQLQQLREAVHIGETIVTLGISRPNRIVDILPGGVRVETARSKARGAGPQVVPAWMIVAGWGALTERGRLSQQELLNDLNVKRSAFVCALLARLPGVEVESTRPVVLRTSRGSG